MTAIPFSKSVFVNCPFDEDYAPLLEAALFCIVYFGFSPRLSNERLEAGENRLDKIFGLIAKSKYSIHDLSLSRANKKGDVFRMNMPFEYGMDVGLRRSGENGMENKKFLIFERDAYDLKAAMSDVAGQDVAHHSNDYEVVIRKIRDFFRVEAEVNAPGSAQLVSDYATFQGWVAEKKISEGHSEAEALKLPTRELLDEMINWIELNKPSEFLT